MDKYERRRLRLIELRDTRCNENAADLARKIERDPSYVTRMLYPEGKAGKKRIADDMMEIIETAFSLPRGWLDQAGEQIKPRNAIVGYRRVWVIGNGSGGLPDRVWTDSGYPAGSSDRYAEERTDDEHAFIVRVHGDSMSPRYMPGEYVLIEPSIAPDTEDEVLVRLASGETMIKRLLSRRGGIKLGSYNTPETMTFREDEITWMYYVSNRVPAHKIKHWIESTEYAGEERRHLAEPHDPERRSGYVLPEPKSEMEHVYGRNLAPSERAHPVKAKRRKS